MTNNFIFGISLTASFLAGVLALFAPCCVTFLFPSYLGTVFKEGKKVMVYTVIFALGLSSILIPVALGFRVLVFFFDAFHRQVYYLGGVFLVFMGIMTIKPILNFQFSVFSSLRQRKQLGNKINAGSVFGLGIVSGLTSSCCAPVLFAAVTLTTLSPTLFQAIIVSGAYVLGIVFPLFLMSLGYAKATRVLSGNRRQRVYTVFKYLGAGIFILSGILIIIFAAMNKLQMGQMDGYSTSLRMIVFNIAKYFRNPVIDLVTFITIVAVFIYLIRKSYRL